MIIGQFDTADNRCQIVPGVKLSKDRKRRRPPIWKWALAGKWDGMLQWLSDIVPLCSARHDVCSWLPHLPCQVSYFLFLWMLRITVVDFSLPRPICFEYISIPCQLAHGQPIWFRDPMHCNGCCKKHRCWWWSWFWQWWSWWYSRAIGAPEEPDSFLLQSPLWPWTGFSPLWPWRDFWHDWDIQVWSLAPAWSVWPRMTTNTFNNHQKNKKQ